MKAQKLRACMHGYYFLMRNESVIESEDTNHVSFSTISFVVRWRKELRTQEESNPLFLVLHEHVSPTTFQFLEEIHTKLSTPFLLRSDSSHLR